MFNSPNQQQTADEDLLVSPALKLILWQAISEKASMVVFGEPCDDGCERIPYQADPLTEPASSEGRRIDDLIREIDELIDLENEDAEGELSPPSPPPVPLWYRKGDAYEGQAPFPVFLLDEFLRIAQKWNGFAVAAGMDSPVQQLVKISALDPGELCRFQMMCDDCRTVDVVLKGGPNWHFVLTYTAA
jgi:hypothetical protein